MCVKKQTSHIADMDSSSSFSSFLLGFELKRWKMEEEEKREMCQDKLQVNTTTTADSLFKMIDHDYESMFRDRRTLEQQCADPRISKEVLFQLFALFLFLFPFSLFFSAEFIFLPFPVLYFIETVRIDPASQISLCLVFTLCLSWEMECSHPKQT